jgi:hypothetical protein
VSAVTREGVPYEAFAYESLDVAGTAVGWTAATYAPSTNKPAKVAHVVVEGGAIRYRCDGTDPTAAEGMPVEVGGVFTVLGALNIKRFRAIRRDGVSAILHTEFGT